MKHVVVFLVITISLLSIFGSSAIVFADSAKNDIKSICEEAVSNGDGNTPSFCTDYAKSTKDDNPVVGIINKVANIIAFLAGAVATIMIMYAGYGFITSDGNSEKVSRARQTIFYAAIGLVVIVSARLLVSFAIAVLIK